MSRPPHRIVGDLLETGPFRAPDEVEAHEAPPPAPAPRGKEASQDEGQSGVEGVVALWQAGKHQEASQMVLDGLPSYRDLVQLIFALGQEGAVELASLMDQASESGGAAPEGTQDEVPLEEPPLQ